MSFLTVVKGEITVIENWFETSPIGQAITADYKSALTELETVGSTALAQVVKTIGTAILSGLASGGEAGAFAAGIAAAPAAFIAAGKTVTSSTITFLVNTILNQVSSQTASAS